MMERALIIQHTSVDTPGVVIDLLEQSSVSYQIVRVDKGQSIPAQPTADAMLAFGGPISLHLSDFPDWVEAERELMRRYLDSGRRVFGICLGAQMLASALGADTYPNPEREVGWFPVVPVESTPDFLPQPMTVLHWHQNTFDLPPDAVHLLRSEACAHQAFAVGDQAVGLQFHPEVTEQTIKHFLMVSGLSRKPFKYVQSSETIKQGIDLHLATQNQWLRSFLSKWLFQREKP